MDKSRNSAIIALGSRAGAIVAQASKGVLAAGSRFIAIDTDENCLVDMPPRVSPLLIGKESFAGAGSAGRADAVREAALLAGPKIDRILEEIGQVIVCAYLGGGTADGLLPIIGLQLKENSVPALFILFHPPVSDATATGRARAAVQELRRSQANLILIEAMEPAGVAAAADLVGVLSLRLRQPAALRPDGEAVDTMLQNAARTRVRISGGAGLNGLAAMVESLPVETLPPYETLLAVAVGGAGIPAGTLLTVREMLLSQGWPSSQILFEAAVAESWNDDLLLVEMICRPFVHESRDPAPAMKEQAPAALLPEQPELFSFVEEPAVSAVSESIPGENQEPGQLELPLDIPDPVPVASATPEEEDAAPEPWEDEDIEAGLPEIEEEEEEEETSGPEFIPEMMAPVVAMPSLPVESAIVPSPQDAMIPPTTSEPTISEPADSPILAVPAPTIPASVGLPPTLPVTPSLPVLQAKPLADPAIPAIEANAASSQGEFTLRELKRGIFEKAPPTTWNGENLDVPTYLRRGLRLLRDQPAPQE